MKQTKKKTVKKTAPKRLAPVTALARRPAPAQTLRLVVNDPEKMLPTPVDTPTVGLLSDEAAVGSLGIVEVRLKPEEELVLSEAVNEADVLVKPDGALYLSHPAYTKWFNRAFGRLGWALVPKAKPMKGDNLVYVPYVLYIHGQPVAFAIGEQEYHANNRNQSFGDAIEATVASGLRRAAKRIGVSLELWDKAWIRRFQAQHCVQVKVEKKVQGEKKIERQWRLKIEPRFWNELGGASAGVDDAREADDGVAGVSRPAVHAAERTPSSPVITAPMRDRLVKIARKAGRIDADVQFWLKKKYGVTSTAGILVSDYDSICDQLAVKGALPLPGDGQ